MKATEVSQWSDCSVKWSSGYTAIAPVYILPSQTQTPLSYGMTFEPYTGDFIYGKLSLWRDYIVPPVMVSHLLINVLPSNIYIKIELNLRSNSR